MNFYKHVKKHSLTLFVEIEVFGAEIKTLELLLERRREVRKAIHFVRNRVLSFSAFTLRTCCKQAGFDEYVRSRCMKIGLDVSLESVRLVVSNTYHDDAKNQKSFKVDAYSFGLLDFFDVYGVMRDSPEQFRHF